MLGHILITVMCMQLLGRERIIYSSSDRQRRTTMTRSVFRKSTTKRTVYHACRQQKDKEKRRARGEALKEGKARVEEEERHACCERQVWQEATTRHVLWTVLRLQMKKVLDIVGTFSFHFLTHFFLCMYKVIMVYQRLFIPLNCTLILNIHCWYPMYSLRLAPQWFTLVFSNTQHYAVCTCVIGSCMPSCRLQWLMAQWLVITIPFQQYGCPHSEKVFRWIWPCYLKAIAQMCESRKFMMRVVCRPHSLALSGKSGLGAKVLR